MQNENNNDQPKQIILTNGSIITPIELNGEVVRGQRRKVVDWSDLGYYVSEEELGKILAPFVVKK